MGKDMSIAPFNKGRLSEGCGDVPNSSILHSLRNLRESSSNFASIARDLFLFSSSSPSCVLWQAPIFNQRDYHDAQGEEKASQSSKIDASLLSDQRTETVRGEYERMRIRAVVGTVQKRSSDFEKSSMAVQLLAGARGSHDWPARW